LVCRRLHSDGLVGGLREGPCESSANVMISEIWERGLPIDHWLSWYR
jgi:hypothetical protein